MLEEYNVKLNMDKAYEVIGQRVHFAKGIPLVIKMRAAEVMETILFEEDANTGNMKYYPAMADAVIYYILFDMLSDADMTEYKAVESGLEKLHDELCAEWNGYSNYAGTPYELIEELKALLKQTRDEVIRRSGDRNSVANTVRHLAKNLGGDGTSRDVGLIRKMMTEFMMSVRKQTIEDTKAEITDKSSSNVIDMSKYKPKKDK